MARNAKCESAFNVLFSGYDGLFFRELKQPGRLADHSPPSSTEVKNEWRYASAP